MTRMNRGLRPSVTHARRNGNALAAIVRPECVLFVMTKSKPRTFAKSCFRANCGIRLSRRVEHKRSLRLSNLPEGWTDDMNIALAPGRSLEELVDWVLECNVRRDKPTVIVQQLIEKFGLTQADAELALDRACGGVVRAATGRADNCPPKDKDPVAWLSYQKCLKRPDLIAAIYPKFAKPPRKHWWQRFLP